MLFDEAVSHYNAKQTRSDRQIKNYYEKIRTGKQEKLFHELILQIGNKVEEIGEVVAKPAVFDGKKVVISRDDFEHVKTLAQKQIAVEHEQTGFIIENKALSAENKILFRDNFQLKQEVSEQKNQLFDSRLTISKLESKLKKLQRLFARILQFIEKLGLKQQLDKFLEPQRERK